MQQWCELEYDPGDEMYYPVEDSSVEGLSFYAMEQSLQKLDDAEIIGISVHKWNLG